MVEAFETDPEAFAELMVELTDPFAQRAAALAKAGLDEAALDRLSKHWSGRFAAEARKADGVAQRFGEAYSRARGRPRAQPSALGSVPRAEPPPAAQAQPPAWAARHDLPSHAPIAPPPVISGSTSAIDEDTEATLTMGRAIEEPLPFHAGQGPPRQAFESAVAHAHAVQGRTAPGSKATDTTADLPCVVDPPTLPAGWRQSSPEPARVEGAARPVKAQRPGGTLQLPEFAPPAAAVVLSEQPLDPIKKPSLTLEQYAWLCAELGEYPEHKAKILMRYGLDGDDARRAEDMAWARRFTANIEIGNRWHQLVAGYRQWLVQQRMP